MKNEVDKRLDLALKRILEEDRYLFEIDINERSISHRLALYLQVLFPDWDVDCEYNRNLLEVKSLNIPRNDASWDDTEGKTIFTDIIIHHRGKNDNLLVIEIKKNVRSDFDMRKQTKESILKNVNGLIQNYREVFFVFVQLVMTQSTKLGIKGTGKAYGNITKSLLGLGS